MGFNTTVSEMCYWANWKRYLLCAAGQGHMSKGLTAHLSGRLVWIISNKLYSSQAGHLPKSDRFHHTTILKVRYGRPNFSLSIGDRFSDAGTKFCLSSLTLSYIWVILSLCSSARTHTCTRTLTNKVIFCKTAGIPLESSLSLCCCTRIHSHTHAHMCACVWTHVRTLKRSLCVQFSLKSLSPLHSNQSHMFTRSLAWKVCCVSAVFSL